MPSLSLLGQAALAGVLIGIPCVAHAAPGEPPPLIPRSLLFGNPVRSNPTISPCGTWLAYLAPLNDVMNVWVEPIAGGDARAVTRSEVRPIFMYTWATNSEQILYMQDEGGDENFHLFAADPGSGESRNLTPFPGARASSPRSHRDRPDEILIEINDRDPRMADLFRLNTRTGERTKIFENTTGYVGMVTDDAWQVRATITMREDGGMDVRLRDDEEAEWFDFLTIAMEDTLTTQPFGFTRDGSSLFMMDSTDRNTAAVMKVPATPDGMSNRALIHASDRADVSDAMFNPTTGAIEAVATEYLRTEWTLLDPAIEKDFNGLRALDGGDFRVSSRSRDDRSWIVSFMQDDGPVRYYHWNRDTQTGRYLFNNRPELESYTLLPMRPVEIPSRDGLTLPSYITLPHRTRSEAVPMVLLVHGGPWARDAWGFNPYHQWLANRGYAVLSVNFRGSTGFGKDFINAGNLEWYGKMQDDLVDAVKWAIDQGYTTTDRVAIMGGSYGGYAVLAGLTRDPDLFACGVNIVGVSHVGTLLQTIPPYWEPLLRFFETRVGSLSDTEFLDSISPLTHVDRIRKPLLIGQGANDPRVKISESDQIVEAMNRHDIPVTYVVFPDEGHGFARPVNNMAFNAVTEIFLAEHLGGRYEPIGEDIARSTAQIRELGDLSLPGVERFVPPAPAPVTADAADDRELTIEDLPEALRDQAAMILEQISTAPPEMLPTVLQQLESQAASVPENLRPLFRYVRQEIRRMIAEG